MNAAHAADSPCRPHPQRPRRPRWMMFGLLGLMLLAALGLSEFAYRAVRIALYQQAIASMDTSLYRPEIDSPLEYRLRADTTIRIPYFDDRSKSFELVTNHDGFRGRPLEDTYPGARRILFLGDSYTLAWGLDEDEPGFVAQTERLLNADAATTRALTFNAGVPGYNTVQQSVLLRELLGRHAFDAVVLAYVINDTEPQHIVPDRPAVTYRHVRSWMLTDAAELIERIASGNKDYNSPHKLVLTNHYLPSYAPESFKWKATREALDHIAATCRELGVPLEVFILPDFNIAWQPEYSYAAVHAQVAATCSELGIASEDLMPRFAGHANTDYALQGDGHPNLAAHAVIAQAIAERLQNTRSN